MRYHSLVIDEATLSDDLFINARVKDKTEDSIMAIRHKKHNLVGIQFHTESIFTDQGSKLIFNFLESINVN